MKNSVFKKFSGVGGFWFSFCTKMNSSNFILITSQSGTIFHDVAPTNMFYIQRKPNTEVSIYDAADVESELAKTVHSKHVRSVIN